MSYRILNGVVPFLARFGPSAGSVNVKRLPLPSTLSHQMRPPCNSIMLLVMASPSPSPPCLRAMCGSTW